MNSTETNSSSKGTSNQLKNDEIDIFQLIQSIWKNKIIIILSVLLGILISGIYTNLIPKEYKSYTSFVIPTESSSLNTYSSLLGINSESNAEKIIINILKSNLIKQKVAETLLNEYKVDLAQKNIQEKPKKLNHIINSLKLNKNLTISKNKTGLTIIKYSSTDINKTKQIIDEYLIQLKKLNHVVEFSAQKNILTIIDPAQLPLTHFKPKPIQNLVLGILLSLFASIGFIVIKSLINSEKQH